MTHRVHSLVAAVALVTLAGCSGLHVGPEAAKSQGIRYYQRAPFLLVYTDNAGGLTTKLLYLPDTRKVMSAYPYAILASNDTTLEFTDGVLTTGTVDADSTVVPKAVLAALEKVVTTSIGLASNAPTGPLPTLPGPVLYRIDVREDGTVVLVGSDQDLKVNFGTAPAGGAQ